MRSRLALVPLLVLTLTACSGSSPSSSSSGAREYPLHGQILSIAADHRETTVKHDDIPNFMPAMTMAYRVRDEKELNTLTAGDIVDATLVVDNGTAWLKNIRRTGHADVPAGGVIPRVMEVAQPGDAVPDQPLIDQSGATTSLATWRGQALAVTFVYTRCPLPNFCPLMDRNFAAMQKDIQRDPALAKSTHLVSISFDPEHDTPAVLADHARKVGADPRFWTFLTGTPKTIEGVASRFGVSVIREKDAGNTITHNLRTAIVDRNGKLVKIYTGNDWTPDALVQDLRDAARH